MMRDWPFYVLYALTAAFAVFAIFRGWKLDDREVAAPRRRDEQAEIASVFGCALLAAQLINVALHAAGLASSLRYSAIYLTTFALAYVVAIVYVKSNPGKRRSR